MAARPMPAIKTGGTRRIGLVPRRRALEGEVAAVLGEGRGAARRVARKYRRAERSRRRGQRLGPFFDFAQQQPASRCRSGQNVTYFPSRSRSVLCRCLRPGVLSLFGG